MIHNGESPHFDRGINLGSFVSEYFEKKGFHPLYRPSDRTLGLGPLLFVPPSKLIDEGKFSIRMFSHIILPDVFNFIDGNILGKPGSIILNQSSLDEHILVSKWGLIRLSEQGVIVPYHVQTKQVKSSDPETPITFECCNGSLYEARTKEAQGLIDRMATWN